MFFPFCLSLQQSSYKDYRRQKLKQLKAFRDMLETRLAATNAAIETVERQLDEGEPSPSEAA
ncbi:MAG: hypothetical protein AAFY11_12795 [Cyanobacteria bacterium J06641_5]